MLEGFKKYSLTVGTAQMTVTKNGVTFNKSAVVKLGKPEKVLLLINDDKKAIAIKTSDDNEEDAAAFYKKKKNDVTSVRWGNRDLLQTISQMMDWNLANDGYKIDGIYYQDEHAMIFNLTTATKFRE